MRVELRWAAVTYSRLVYEPGSHGEYSKGVPYLQCIGYNQQFTHVRCGKVPASADALL
jgi:hypothetical protein